MVQPMRHDLTPRRLRDACSSSSCGSTGMPRRRTSGRSKHGASRAAQGQRPRRRVPNYEPDASIPKSGALEPLAFLLPHNRDDYTFAWNGVGRLKDRPDDDAGLQRRATAGRRSRGDGKGDCVSIDAPGRTKGRIWIDEDDARRAAARSKQLTSQFEVPHPARALGRRRTADVGDRACRFVDPLPAGRLPDPDETVLLPESIDGADGVQRGAVVPDRRRPSPATSASSPGDESSSDAPAVGRRSGC